MSSLQAPAFLAGGNINPATLVTLTGPFTVSQVTAATVAPVGVSQPSTKQPPGVIGSDGLAAHSGETLQVYGEGDICLVQVGAAGVTAGNYLKSDGTANGTVAAVAMTSPAAYTQNAGIWAVGQALETANPGEWVRMVVRIFFLPQITA